MPVEKVTFQSATPATPPAATEVAVDRTAEGDVQLVKLAVSADGGSAPAPVDATNGVGVDVKRAADVVDATQGSTSDPDSANTVVGRLKKLVSLLAGGLPAALSANGALKVEQVVAAPTQPVSGTVTANAGTGPFPVSDNGGSLTVDGSVAVTGTATTDPSDRIGRLLGEVNGRAAIDAAIAGNPHLMGGRASRAIPSLVAADGRAQALWTDRRGAQMVVQAVPDQAMYFFNIPTSVHVAAASTLFWDIFNADAALVVRVLLIQHIVNLETAVTGVGFEWQLLRTTAVGTGGTAITGWPADTSDTALDADVTCRSKPTSGATASTSLRWHHTNSEETLAGNQLHSGTSTDSNIVPQPLVDSGKGIVLRQNQGLRLNQETNSAAGNSGFLIGVAIDGV